MIATAGSFLSILSASSRDALLTHASPVDLPLRTTLYEPLTTPRYAYFLLTGLASVVTPTLEGKSAEVAFIGREGVIGSLHLLGPAPVPTHCMMQLAGNALRIPFAALQHSFASSQEVHGRILEFVQEQSAVIAQIAGCNRLHTAEARLARWLLMAQDHTGFDMLTFTHEYLAEMISTQRSTVSVIAGELQERGVIRYSRGTIHIRDRPGLERAACACYPLIQGLFTGLYSDGRRFVAAT